MAMRNQFQTTPTQHQIQQFLAFSDNKFNPKLNQGRAKKLPYHIPQQVARQLVVFSPTSRVGPSIQLQSPAQRLQQKQFSQSNAAFQTVMAAKTKPLSQSPSNRVQSAVRTAYQPQNTFTQVGVRSQRRQMTSHGTRRPVVIVGSEIEMQENKWNHFVETQRRPLDVADVSQPVTITKFDTNQSYAHLKQKQQNPVLSPATRMTTFSPETNNTNKSNDSQTGGNDKTNKNLNFQKPQYLNQQNQPKVQNKKHLNINEIQQYATITNSNRVMKFASPTAQNINSARIYPGPASNYNTIQYGAAAKDYINHNIKSNGIVQTIQAEDKAPIKQNFINMQSDKVISIPDVERNVHTAQVGSSRPRREIVINSTIYNNSSAAASGQNLVTKRGSNINTVDTTAAKPSNLNSNAPPIQSNYIPGRQQTVTSEKNYKTISSEEQNNSPNFLSSPEIGINPALQTINKTDVTIETENQQIISQPQFAISPEPVKKQVSTNQDKKQAEAVEEIIFSENHNLDDYLIGKQIGQGAYALVFLGLNQRSNTKVALKIYQKEKMKDLQRKKSIRREIKIMQRINHPNIAKLYDVIETDTQVILVMEYINGGSTHGYLKSKPNRRMDEHNAKKIISQLLSALHYLHSKCIAHRDIKLENVMLDNQRNVKLIDFGFSTQIPNTQKVKLFCGTPSYMAPEIVQKLEFCGPPADVYAAGVLLFAFFCGCFPFRGQNDKELYKKIATAELILPDHIPSGPKYLLKYMLKKSPDERPTSLELLQDPWIQSGLAAVKEQNTFQINQVLRPSIRSSDIKLNSKRQSSTVSPTNQKVIQAQIPSPVNEKMVEVTTQQHQIQQQRPFHPLATVNNNQASKPSMRPQNLNILQQTKPASSYYSHRAPPQTAQGNRTYNLTLQQSSKNQSPVINTGLPINQEAFQAYYEHNQNNPIGGVLSQTQLKGQGPETHQTINNNINIINNITQITCTNTHPPGTTCSAANHIISNEGKFVNEVQSNNWTQDRGGQTKADAKHNVNTFNPSGIRLVRNTKAAVQSDNQD